MPLGLYRQGHIQLCCTAHMPRQQAPHQVSCHKGVVPRHVAPVKEGPYHDRPPLCPFRLLPLLIYSGSTIAFLKILKVQGPKSKNIENVILLQP